MVRRAQLAAVGVIAGPALTSAPGGGHVGAGHREQAVVGRRPGRIGSANEVAVTAT